MASILLSVEKPTDDTDDSERRWDNCSSNLRALSAQNKDLQLLGENVVLISLSKTLDPLSTLVQKLCGLSYRFQVHNEETPWISVARQK